MMPDWIKDSIRNELQFMTAEEFVEFGEWLFRAWLEENGLGEDES